MSSQILSFIFGAVGLLVAIWLGMSLAQGEWLNLIILFGFVLGLIFVSGGYRYAFHLLFFFVLLNGTFTIGTAIRSTEQFLVITCAIVAATFWRRPAAVPPPSVLRHWSFSFVQVALFAWIFYVGIHMAIHLLLFRTEGLQNILKSYNATFTPYLFLLYFLRRPQMLPIPHHYLRVLSLIVSVVVLVSITFRVYQTYYGAPLASPDPSDADMAGPLYIHFLSFTESIYSLRGLGPYSILLGAILWSSNQKLFHVGIRRFVGPCLLAAGIVGSLYSGGRAAIVIGVCSAMVVLILKRKRSLVFIAFAGAILTIVTANLFSSWVNTKAPMQISRTLQWILLEKDETASGSIKGSSEWRVNLAKYALQEWRRDAKTIAIGVGFQGISASDWAAAGFAGTSLTRLSQEFAWEMSVKRVSTHNLFTDLLVGYGLIGALIYYAFLLCLMAFTAHIYFALPDLSIHKDFALFTAGVVWTASLLSNFGGTFLSAQVILFVIALVCALFQQPETFSKGQSPQR